MSEAISSSGSGTRKRRSQVSRSTIGVVVASTITASVPDRPWANSRAAWATEVGPTDRKAACHQASAGAVPTLNSTEIAPRMRKTMGALMAASSTRGRMRAAPTIRAMAATATSRVPGQVGASSAVSTSPMEQATFSPTRRRRQGLPQAASSSAPMWRPLMCQAFRDPGAVGPGVDPSGEIAAAEEVDASAAAAVTPIAASCLRAAFLPDMRPRQ
ncbi:hypothetical protein MAJHIDBO_00723 [Propionibacterium freudenreichii subsp. shermanii]|nr:hypothetical protein MAJHIDBO_00723 [Propionibacterium freudenreichii subsp. shermanii]SPS08532.1 hypothetical protein MAJHIDBO_00723 [Propionibacterium freudenreichii subsp. shermanii]